MFEFLLSSSSVSTRHSLMTSFLNSVTNILGDVNLKATRVPKLLVVELKKQDWKHRVGLHSLGTTAFGNIWTSKIHTNRNVYDAQFK